MMPADPGATPGVPRPGSPFDRLHATMLLVQCVLGGIVAGSIGALISRRATAAASEWLMFMLFYVGAGAVLAFRVWRSGLDVGRLFGPLPSRSTLRLTVVVVPLMALAFAGFWVLFLPLSFVAPGLVRQWGLATANMPQVVTLSAWALQFVVAAVLAPITEEVLFRGILLQRWATKWSTPSAVIVSSTLFAIGHVEILGHFVFGAVMCALYLRTKSLWVPIATHALNNGLVSLAMLSAVLHPGPPEKPMTLQSLRSEWWLAAMLLVVGIALLDWYRRRYWAGIRLRTLFSAPVPYFSQ